MSSRTLNKIELVGNVGEDPEMAQTSGGTSVCTFRVATNRTWKSTGSDEMQEETQWHNIVTFGKFADVCQKIVRRSKKVYIDGRIKSDTFTNEDGAEYTKTEIVADKLIILDDKEQSSSNDDYDTIFEESEYIYT